MAKDHTPQQHHNLIRDDIVSLAQYSIHYRDADELVITDTLQLMLHDRSGRTLFGQSYSNNCTDLNIPFNIVRKWHKHTAYIILP